MKKISMYQCELCNEIYDVEENAIKYESQGIQIPSIKVGQKLNYLEGCIEDFDIPIYTPSVVLEIKVKGHDVLYVCSEIIPETGKIWQPNIKYKVYEDELEYCELI